MTFDLIIKNGRIIIGDEIIYGGIGVIDGKIAAIINGNLEFAKATETIDANNNYVLPGLIDVNIHMRVPGLDHKEDFTTGTSAAAAGGVTTVLDMPNTKPPTTTIQRLEEKKALVKGKSVIDYAFHFQGAKDNTDELKKLEDVPSVKFFMAGHETTPTTVNDVGILYEAFDILAKRKIPATVHAENQAIINVLMKKYQNRTDFKAYSDARDDTVCEMAVNEIITIARATGCKTHICHISTQKEIQAIKRAKSDGVDITCEAVPYHLFLTYDDCKRLGSFAKVSPALKSLKDQETLWDAIADGTVDCITSEHTPHTLEEKTDSVWNAPAGTPGIQEMLPLLVNKGMSLTSIARLCAEAPARIFQINGKGKIQLGYDADIVILDPDKEWVVNKGDLFSKCQWSSYEGWHLKGRPLMTLVRGKIVYKDGKVLCANKGQMIYY